MLSGSQYDGIMNESLNPIEVPDRHGLGGKQTWWASSRIFKQEISQSDPIVWVITRSQQNAVAGYAAMFFIWLIWANGHKELIASQSMIGVLVGVAICSAVSAYLIYLFCLLVVTLSNRLKPKKV